MKPWASSVGPLSGEALVLLVTDVALKAIKVVGLAHVIHAPLPRLESFQKAQIGNLAGSLELQVARIRSVVTVQSRDEFRKLAWAREVVDDDSRVLVGQPVGHGGGSLVNGYAALVERTPQLLRHVVRAQAVLHGQVELVPCHEAHKLTVLTSGRACVLQTFWQWFVVQALSI